ncbi:ribonuclease H-like domain-containing protein [Tanacetum coccineum]
MSVPVTAEEKTNKKNDVKARSLLLMLYPRSINLLSPSVQIPMNARNNDYPLKLSKNRRWGGGGLDVVCGGRGSLRGRGGVARGVKLGHQRARRYGCYWLAVRDLYRNGGVLSDVGERHTECLGVVITQKDLNSKNFRSLPPEWNTHVVVWMNKAEIETMSIDDLYNNFKIVKQSVKKSVGASSGAQNLAFMTALSTSSTNGVNTTKPVYEVSTVSPNVNTASPQVSTASFSDNVVYAFMVENPNGSNLLQQDLEQILKDDLESNRFEDGTLFQGCRAPRNKEGFDWSNNERKNEGIACEDCEINVLKSEFEKVKQEKEGIEFKIEKFDNASKSLNKLLESQITDKSKKGLGLNSEVMVLRIVSKSLTLFVIKKSDDSKENFDDSLVKEQVSKDTSSFVESPLNVDKETIFLVDRKIEFVKPKNHEKPDKKSVRYAEMYRSQSLRGNQRNWNGQKSNQLGSDFVMYNKACFICGSFDHVQAHCKYHQRERMVYGNNYNRVNYNYTTNRTHPNAQRNMVPRAVLMKTGLKTFNTARTVNTAHPKSTVYSAKPMSCFSKSAQSTVKRPYQSKTVLTNKNFTQKVNTAKAQAVNTARPKAVNTARPKAVKTARPNSAVVNAVRGKPQQDDTGFIDSGCSRHMTGNIAYLLDFKEFDGGYVTFRGGAHGGRISGKGTLKTDSLDFEDVYFVNELKFNLFSVSQMCDKKNYVLFTDTECLVLSPNFKLPDETTSYESKLWHRRKETSVDSSKTYQNEIENLVDKKVKIIRSDNGTEFKNKVMDDFCREKDVGNDERKSATDDQKQVEDGTHNESAEKDKSDDDSSPKEVNIAGQHVNIVSPDVNTSHFKLNTVDLSVNTANSF